MTTPPLSPAAQAVFDAFVAEAGPGHRHQREAVAAAIRALAEQVAPETLPAGLCDPELQSFVEVINRTFRTKLQSIAAELDGGAGQHTTQPTEPHGEQRGLPVTVYAQRADGSLRPIPPFPTPTETPDEHA
jgi:hypothetical protein